MRQLHVPKGRQDVEPDPVVVAVAGRLFDLDDLEPLADRLGDRDRGLRVLLLIDLPLQAVSATSASWRVAQTSRSRSSLPVSESIPA
jgi:hypothetical protein